MDKQDFLINALIQQRNVAQDQLADALAEANMQIENLKKQIEDLKKTE